MKLGFVPKRGFYFSAMTLYRQSKKKSILILGSTEITQAYGNNKLSYVDMQNHIQFS